MRSKTGCGSPGEAAITFSTSIVATCCSIRSANAVLRSASSVVRICNARQVSALPMAITACSAKVFSSSTWVSENPPRCRLPMTSAPIAAAPRIIGTTTEDFTASSGEKRRGRSLTRTICPSRIARPWCGIARWCHRKTPPLPRPSTVGSWLTPVYARNRIRVPSNSSTDTPYPPQMSRARSAINSNTGCGSLGEADIAFSTSIVAD